MWKLNCALFLALLVIVQAVNSEEKSSFEPAELYGEDFSPREGDKCTIEDTGSTGVCRSFANCQTAVEAASKGILPQRCDSERNESELVCCASAVCPALLKGLVTQLPIGSKAADYCIDLAEKIHPCQETPSGWTRGDICPQLTLDSNVEYQQNPMITTAEAPYFGRIGSGGTPESATWQWYAVTLVSDRFVLCPAFAIYALGASGVKYVGLGGTFTPQYNPDEIYGVTKQYPHPQFNSIFSLVYNDIALLLLDRRVTFTRRILPVCLHTGTPLPVSGFTQTWWEYSAGKHLKTTMQRVSAEECSRIFPSGTRDHPYGVKHDLELCSRPVNTIGKCTEWYYGSALTLPNSHRVACTHLLVGLRSDYVASPCTYTNTRISSYIPWIEGIVWPESGILD